MSNVLSKVAACSSLSIAEATVVVAPLRVAVDVQCAEELFDPEHREYYASLKEMGSGLMSVIFIATRGSPTPTLQEDAEAAARALEGRTALAGENSTTLEHLKGTKADVILTQEVK